MTKQQAQKKLDEMFNRRPASRKYDIKYISWAFICWTVLLVLVIGNTL